MYGDDIVFVVGLNLRSVAQYALNDIGWVRTAPRYFEDSDGRTIKYVVSADDLNGYQGNLIYLIDGYNLRDDWYEIDERISERGFERHFL